MSIVDGAAWTGISATAQTVSNTARPNIDTDRDRDRRTLLEPVATEKIIYEVDLKRTTE
jgi:hypothetical protein